MPLPHDLVGVGRAAGAEVVVDGWYAQRLLPGQPSADDRLRGALPEPVLAVARRVPVLRGFALWWLTRRSRTVAVINVAPGALTLLVLEALFRRRQPRIVLLEFIGREPPERPVKRLLWTTWFRLLRRPAVRHGVRRAHVLTEWERQREARTYGMPVERFVHVPWPLRRDGGDAGSPGVRKGRRVVCTGRSHCDWETFFAAARGREWEVEVVCAGRDRERVETLAEGTNSIIRHEVTLTEHDTVVAGATVYVLALRDAGASTGHVRLMAARQAGVPVVATDVRGLAGYVSDGCDAVLVDPGDPEALGRAVDGLLASSDRRSAIAAAAWRRSRDWTYEHYLARLRELITA